MKVKVYKKRKTDRECLEIHTEWIRLDALLKFAALAETGGEAKIMVQEGEVSVNGEICKQRGRKIRPGDIIAVDGKEIQVTDSKAGSPSV